MALINITVEKVIVKHDDEVIIDLLKKILALVNNKEDEALRQEIMDKLNALKTDIEGTIS